MASDQRSVTKNLYKKTGRQEAKEDAGIELSRLTYLYPNNATQVLNSVSFKFAAGEVVAIVGASGSGKSTMLKLVAGLLQPTKGKVITEKGRRVGLAPQSPTLLPWLSVIENITFKERLGERRKVSKEEAKRLLDRFGIGDKTDSKPSELSGGMQSRAALARALAGSPDVLLLDEPFSTLDEVTAEAIMLDLSELLEQTRPTTIFVSHNIAQAAFLADKIVVLAGSPAKILGVVPVNSPKPRGPKVINGDKITSAAREVRKLLKGAAQ